MDIRDRKHDHIELTVDGRSAYAVPTGFERIRLVHNALPELSYDGVSTAASLLGRRFRLPVLISSMTGGTARAAGLNEILARFCADNDLPMGLGSQRAMLEKPELEASFAIARQVAPDLFLAANIGGQELTKGWTTDHTRRLIGSVRADAVIVHLNPLQELVQPEGDRDFRGIADGIARLVDDAGVPVVVKETGAGISGAVGLRLADLGVRAVDVAGAGGTSWGKVEAFRRPDGDHRFDDWGIPTVDCIQQNAPLTRRGVELIASGGIRTAEDIAKALALGATFTGIAQPVMAAAVQGGREALDTWLATLERHLRMVLVLTGAAEPAALDRTHLRIF